MWCMPRTPKKRQELQMYTVVEQPLTAHDVGSISCRPMGLEPIQFEWSGTGRDRLTFVDQSESEATNVIPGRYRVRASDANGNRADVTIDVRPLYDQAFVVTEYRVQHASTRFARDGCVEVVGQGAHEGMRFLWTTGVETDVPRISDVPSGTYAVVAVSHVDDSSSSPVTVHRCSPARVDVR